MKVYRDCVGGGGVWESVSVEITVCLIQKTVCMGNKGDVKRL